MTPDDATDDVAPSEPGRVVRVYAVTGGRTRSTAVELPMESLVSATQRAPWPGMPIVRVDARVSASCTAALIALVEHALDRSDGSTRRTAPARTGPLAAHSYLP